MELIKSNRAVHGTVVLAHWQEQGRGHRGNSWNSEPGMNLLLSIILFPQFLKAEKQFYLSKIASIALTDLLKDKTSGISIKWPNDIYAGDRKISGMLIENMVQGTNIHASVVGIGLNVNQTVFGRDLPNPVSLKLLTGEEYSIEDLADCLVKIFFEWYDKLQSGTLALIDSEYLDNLYRKGEWAYFLKEGKQFEARITGIGDYGQLITEDRSGNSSEHLFKEIEFVR
jgi:BirA family biotin operon repressor/biotin-[acetyl-CoA-carboxylase] ligase